MPSRFIAGLCLAVLAAVPCSAGARILVVGSLARDYRPPLEPGSSVHVVKNPEADAPALHEEFRAKAENELREQGYGISTAADAQFLVFFGFGTKEHPARTIQPGVRIGRYGEDSADPNYPDAFVRGPRFSHYFTITVVDGALFRDSGEVSVVWAGEARYGKRQKKDPEKQLELLDTLMAAAFDRFGQDTGWKVWQRPEAKRVHDDP